jgi:hypothetical protein
MARSRQTPLEKFRSRQQRKGIVRVELQVHKDDAPLMRLVAQALGDPLREGEARSLLSAWFAAPNPVGLKTLLASAPLDGIDIARPRDIGRPVELWAF